MPNDFSRYRLINIDSMLEELDEEVGPELIDLYVCTLSFKNFDFLERRLHFVLDLKTDVMSTWTGLVAYSKTKYWLRNPGFGVLVFDAVAASGFIRTYRFAQPGWPGHAAYLDDTWIRVKDEATLYAMLDTPSAKALYDAWFAHQSRVTELPTEFVQGRHANTTVQKSMIFSSGEGCVGCGAKPVAYAATTVGHTDAPVLVHLPVCQQHLESAKAHPTILHFLASVFSLSFDWEVLQKLDALPDELIPAIHGGAAEELQGATGVAEHRDNGWLLQIPLASGWTWRLRLRKLTDFSYMLYDPTGKQRYRADSAPHHPEVPFFPNHQHSRPDSKRKDQVTPSFLYGHPLLDLKRLKAVGHEYGAY